MKSDKKIYVISAHYLNDTGDREENRTFGFYFDQNDAIAAVAKDYGSMHECLYNYLVIEEVCEGISALATAIQWYTWKPDVWVECDCPVRWDGIINFGIG